MVQQRTQALIFKSTGLIDVWLFLLFFISTYISSLLRPYANHVLVELTPPPSPTGHRIPRWPLLTVEGVTWPCRPGRSKHWVLLVHRGQEAPPARSHVPWLSIYDGKYRFTPRWWFWWALPHHYTHTHSHTSSVYFQHWYQKDFVFLFLGWVKEGSL